MRFPTFHFGEAIALGLSMLCMSTVPVFADGMVTVNVTDCTGLQNMINNLNRRYVLQNDIDCTGTSFTPVGKAANFSGALEGNGYTISNLSINGSSLFEQFSGTVSDVLFTGVEAGSGVLIGTMNGGSVSQVSVADFTVSGSYPAGGIAGMIKAGTMDQVSASGGTVTGTQEVGGVVGTMRGGTLSNASARNLTIHNTGATFVGGLIGMIDGEWGQTITVTNAFADTSVSADLWAGGAIGWAASFTDAVIISNIFATGASSNHYAHGAGGLIGRTVNVSLSNAFYNATGDNTSDCIGDILSGSAPCTKKNDTISYFYDSANEPLASWDFPDTWIEQDGAFPLLAWLHDSVPPDSPTDFSGTASGDAVHLSWVNPTDGDFASVSIYGSTSAYIESAGGGSAVVTGLPDTSWDVYPLADGTYYYTIFAKDTNDNYSAPAYLTFRIDTTPPSAPSGFTTTVSGNDVSLHWTNPVDADFAGITVRYGLSAYPTSITDGSALVSDIVATSATQTDLGTGTYYYSIFATDETGNVSLAAQASATVTAVDSSGGGGGGGGRSGGSHGTTSQSHPSASRQSPSMTTQTMQTSLQVRTCERVTKHYATDKNAFKRVNERLQKRLGFTCGS